MISNEKLVSDSADALVRCQLAWVQLAMHFRVLLFRSLRRLPPDAASQRASAVAIGRQKAARRSTEGRFVHVNSRS